MSRQKLALVTGANRGLGLGTCRALAAMGYRVLLGSRDADAGNAAAAALGSEAVEAVRLDVTSPADIDAVARHVAELFGYLDVLINNAGVMIDNADGRSGSICDADLDAVEQTLRVNTLGPMRLINALLPLLEKVEDARIVNVSSGMGQLSEMEGRHPGYRMSKTALNAMTRIYAAELDPERFSVNALCPGWVRTDMGGDHADLSVEEGVDTAVWLATADEARVSGGFYRERRRIDW